MEWKKNLLSDVSSISNAFVLYFRLSSMLVPSSVISWLSDPTVLELMLEREWRKPLLSDADSPVLDTSVLSPWLSSMSVFNASGVPSFLLSSMFSAFSSPSGPRVKGVRGEDVRRAPNSKGSEQLEQQQQLLQQSHWFEKAATRVRSRLRIVQGRPP